MTDDRFWTSLSARLVVTEAMMATMLDLVVSQASPEALGQVMHRLRDQLEFGIEPAPEDVKAEARVMLEATLHMLTRKMTNVATEDRPRPN